jgi:hypothetical protein
VAPFAPFFRYAAKVTNRCQAEAGHRRSGGAIHHLVEARLTAARKGNDAAIARELQARAWKNLRRPIDRRSKRERRIGLLGIRRTVGEAASGLPRHGNRPDHAHSNEATDRSRWYPKRQAISRLHVELPPQKCNREALLQQESIAEAPLFRREIALSRSTHQRERLVAPAIDDLEKHGSARGTRVFRKEDEQIAVEFDSSLSVPGSGGEIGNRLIGRQPGIDGVMNSRDDGFVGAGIIPADHVDPDHFGGCSLREQKAGPDHTADDPRGGFRHDPSGSGITIPARDSRRHPSKSFCLNGFSAHGAIGVSPSSAHGHSGVFPRITCHIRSSFRARGEHGRQ